MPGEYGGFVFEPDIAGNMPYLGSLGYGGIWRGFDHQFVPAGRGFYPGLAGQKVKVPAIPRTWWGFGYN